jgi:hypothetical protein
MIKRSLFLITFGIAFAMQFIACGNAEDARPTSAQETGQQFIASSLKGDFKKAESLLLNEPDNKALFQTYRRFYDRMSDQQRKGYQTASFEIESWQDLNDSISIIRYTNDFMHQPTELRLVRKNDLWWIDFRFTSTEK